MQPRATAGPQRSSPPRRRARGGAPRRSPCPGLTTAPWCPHVLTRRLPGGSACLSPGRAVAGRHSGAVELAGELLCGLMAQRERLAVRSIGTDNACPLCLAPWLRLLGWRSAGSFLLLSESDIELCLSLHPISSIEKSPMCALVTCVCVGSTGCSQLGPHL